MYFGCGGGFIVYRPYCFVLFCFVLNEGKGLDISTDFFKSQKRVKSSETKEG